MAIYLVPLTFTIREHRDLKTYKNRGWEDRSLKIWIGTILLGIVLLIIALLPILLMEEPQYI